MSKSNMNLKLVTGLLVASGSTVAVASMNNLDVQSNLGEQFSGSIVVTGPTAQEILKSPSSISISGAPVSARVSKQGSAAVIHLRSSMPINDPVLRLKVQAGSESRQYSAIIDPKNAVHQNAQVNSAKAIPHPPVLANSNQTASKPAATPARKAASKPAQQTIQNNRKQATSATPNAAAPSGIEVAQQYKVQAKDNIFEIARKHQPEGLSTAQTVQALMRANPQAFRNHNPNLLYGDATLKIPSAEAMRQLVKGGTGKHVVAAATATTTVVAGSANTTAAPDDVAAIEKQLADLEQQKNQLEKQLVQAQQASAATITTEPTVTASAPSTTVAAPASTPIAAQPKATTPTPAPPVPEEKGLMDLVMEYLPYLAAGLVALLLLAMLIARSRKKATLTGDSVFDDTNDDAVEIFNFDDVALDTNKVTLSKTESAPSQLTDAELDALHSFDPQEEKAFHQSTAKPTVAPDTTMATAATALLGTAAVTAAAHTASEQDFMPSEEELAQYAQPEATPAPISDDFNLDDLDSLLKQNELESDAVASKMEASTPEDFNFDFDVNELAQNNNLNLSTPALDFPDVESVVEAPVATLLPQVEEVSFNEFDTEINATPATSPELNLDLDTVALGAAGVAAVSHFSQDEQTTVNEGLTLSQDDINAINFDSFVPATASMANGNLTDDNVDIDALFQSEAAPAANESISKFNSIAVDHGHELTFDDSFDLNFDDLLSTDDTATVAPTQISAIEDTTITSFTTEASDAINFSDTIEVPVVEEVISSEESKPAQAWAGTGNFGNPVAEEISTEATETATANEANEFNLDFNVDSTPVTNIAPEVIDSTASVTTADSLSFDLDALTPDTPSTEAEITSINEPSVQDTGLAFDTADLNLDSLSTIAEPEAFASNIEEVSFDLNALSLDSDIVEPVISTESDITAAQAAKSDSGHNFDFSLDDLNSELTPVVEATAAPTTDFSLDDFNLGEFATVETTDVQALSAVPAIETNEMDFNLDSLNLESAAETATLPDLHDATSEVAAVIEEPIAATVASDENLVLQSLQHTQEAKLDLAQMYVEIGDKDAALNILIDLMENGSNETAERAEKLYQTL